MAGDDSPDGSLPLKGGHGRDGRTPPNAFQAADSSPPWGGAIGREGEFGNANTSATPHEQTALEDGVFEALTWKVRPGLEQPAKLSAIVIAALLAFTAGTFALHSPLLGIAGSVMILAATAEFWLGTAYAVDEEGASSRTGLSYSRILWKEVKRAVVTPIGIKLSPLEESTRLAPFRGVFLRFGKEDRVLIESAVRMLGGNDVRFVEGTAD